MTAPETAEAWGRLAVSLPGWRWMPGMLGLWSDTHGEVYRPRIDGHPGPWVKGATAGIDPDDPATAGCLLALVGSDRIRVLAMLVDSRNIGFGRACIAYANALGRWPGGS